MRFFRDIPIRNKLIFVMILTSAISLLLASVGTITSEWYRFRKTIVQDITAQAKILSANIAAAFAFGDKVAAQETLQSLHSRPEIFYAGLYDLRGKLFTSYGDDQSSGGIAVVDLINEGATFSKGVLEFNHEVRLEGDRLGTIRFKVNINDHYRNLKSQARIVLVAMVISLIAACFVATQLQRSISQPILRLEHLANQVSEQQDYSLRAPTVGQDEIGDLTNKFNEMLAKIQLREGELFAQTAILQSVLNSMADGVIVASPQGKVILSNPAAEQILGSDLISAPLNLWADRKQMCGVDTVTPLTYDELPIIRAVCGEAVDDVEIYLRRVSGNIWLNISGRPMRNQDEVLQGGVIVLRDVTEYKELQKEILGISDREQARIGQDIHDGLCQTLAAASMSIKMVERRLISAQSAEVVRITEIHGLIKTTIDQAREMARGLYPVVLEVGSLEAALRELTVHVRKYLKIDCIFECPSPIEIQDVTTARHLYRIAQEAVNNAARHGRAHCIVISFHRAKEHVWLTITDDGVGLPNNWKEIKGMGIHTMTYRTRILSGIIEIKNGQNGGTTVACSFPQKEPISTHALSTVLSKAGKSSIGIFLVDDHPVVRERIAEVIRAESDLSVCGEAADRATALRGIAATNPDVVVVDLSLGPRGTGFELIRDLSENHPHVVSLIVSMHGELNFAKRAFEAGAKGYVTKFEPTENVVEAIRIVLAGGRYLSERLPAELLTDIKS